VRYVRLFVLCVAPTPVLFVALCVRLTEKRDEATVAARDLPIMHML